MEEAWEFAVVSGEFSRMQVFLSWSGDRSREIAEAFSDWIPKVLPGTSFFFSPKVSKGDIWFQQIMDGIRASQYGISFVTLENKNNPWLQFESGALANNFDVARITPVLCNLRNSQLENQNPLSKFQTCDLDHEGLSGLIKSIRGYINYPTLAYEKIDETVLRYEQEIEDRVEEINHKYDEVDGEISVIEPIEKDSVEGLVSNLIEEVRSLSFQVSSREKIRLERALNLPNGIEENEIEVDDVLPLSRTSRLSPEDKARVSKIVDKINSANSFGELLEMRDSIHAHSLFLHKEGQLVIKRALTDALAKVGNQK